MYKNPQLSEQAKALAKELSAYGLSLKHSQALEVVARLQGARTLHVAQAKNNAAVAIEAVALAQASALMFKSLGRFTGNVRGLLASIQAAFDLEQTEGSRAVEEAVHQLFAGDNAPATSDMFGELKLSELPSRFEAIFASLQESLAEQARSTAESKAVPADVVFEGVARDWRLNDGHVEGDLPEHHRGTFELTVKRAPYQLFVDMAPKGVDVLNLEEPESVPQMTLFVEVNEGRPCVHMSNALYGDQVLTVFFTPDGLYLRPEASGVHIRTGIPQQGTALHTLQRELNVNRSSFNEAFIPTKQ